MSMYLYNIFDKSVQPNPICRIFATSESEAMVNARQQGSPFEGELEATLFDSTKLGGWQ